VDAELAVDRCNSAQGCLVELHFSDFAAVLTKIVFFDTRFRGSVPTVEE
jgi:hypothetical protein